MAVFKCKMCGASLEVSGYSSVACCDYCGSQQTLPRFSDSNLAGLYERADAFRRNDEFDRAREVYEKILDSNPTDAESYWSIVLCEYGITYVEDPASGKRMPTVNRAQFTSIYDDVNYKMAIQYADPSQKTIYESEAYTINEIQKGILDISQNEEPFDVFICYKETDEYGNRTHDSVHATELYNELTREGFKVFFARITLEDKLGCQYEPYIFAALNSAKVMIVLGTKPEYFDAVWVKNEWSRFLAITKKDNKKKLIPVYRDMDAYNLPKEFSHLQAQDMSRLGFMLDLIRGVRKYVEDANTVKREDPYKQHRASQSQNGSAETIGQKIDNVVSGVKNAMTSEKVNTTVNNVTNNVFNFIGKAKDKVTHEIKEAKTVLSDKGESRSSRVKRLESERIKRVILGIVLLFIYLWPVSCWLFYRAYVINKEINDLKNKK